MDLVLYNEFCSDIEHLESVLNLLDSIKKFIPISIDSSSDLNSSEYFNILEELSQKSKNSNYGMTFIPGTIVLYLGGRFEYYIKSIIEELASSIAIKNKFYSKLPKDLRESLISMTSDVMKNPRKYGHAENGCKSFIKILSDNISEKEITEINAKCVSITSENMRASILEELFLRIGAKDIWKKIGEQSQIQLYFDTDNADNARKEAMKFLNDFIDLRNKVAHPSSSFSWPDTKSVANYIEYFKILGKVIVDICFLYEKTLVKADN